MADQVRLQIITGFDPSGFNRARQGMRQVQESVDTTTRSIGQNRAAMSMVPAQITDIATQLQGGQKPLTILLQQGGQLRDTFGSVGGAVKGVFSYMLGLINPVTLSLVALGGAAVWVTKQYEKMSEQQKLMTESRLGQHRRMIESVKLQVNQLTAAYDMMVKSIETATRASENLTAASGRRSSAATQGQLALLDAEGSQKQRAAVTPEVAEQIKLEYARKRIEIEAAAAVENAQRDENNARRRLDAERRIQAEAARQMQDLKERRSVAIDNNLLSPELDALLTADMEKQRQAIAAQASAVSVAYEDYATAVQQVANARNAEQIAISDAIDAQDRYLQKLEASAAAREEISFNELEQAALTEQGARLQDRINAKLSAAEAAADRLKQMRAQGPAAAFAKNIADVDAFKAAEKDKDEFAKDVERARKKQERGIKLGAKDSRRLAFQDRWDAELARQAAAAAQKTPEQAELEKVNAKLDELKLIRTGLDKALTAG